MTEKIKLKVITSMIKVMKTQYELIGQALAGAEDVLGNPDPQYNTINSIIGSTFGLPGFIEELENAYTKILTIAKQQTQKD